MAVGCQGLRKIGAGGLEVCSDGKRSKSQPQVHLARQAGVRESGTRAGRGWLPAQINDRLIGGCILGLRGGKKKDRELLSPLQEKEEAGRPYLAQTQPQIWAMLITPLLLPRWSRRD